MKPSILYARFTPSHTRTVHDNHMSLQTYPVQFRAVGTLPISGFVSEDTLGLEAACRVAFATAKKRIQLGSDLPYGYNRK